MMDLALDATLEEMKSMFPWILISGNHSYWSLVALAEIILQKEVSISSFITDVPEAHLILRRLFLHESDKFNDIRKEYELKLSVMVL